MTEEIQPWPSVDPEAFEEMTRRVGASLNDAARQLVALIQPGLIAAGRACRDLEDALDAQWPHWREFAASIPDYEPEPPHQGCHEGHAEQEIHPGVVMGEIVTDGRASTAVLCEVRHELTVGTAARPTPLAPALRTFWLGSGGLT